MEIEATNIVASRPPNDDRLQGHSYNAERHVTTTISIKSLTLEGTHSDFVSIGLDGLPAVTTWIYWDFSVWKCIFYSSNGWKLYGLKIVVDYAVELLDFLMAFNNLILVELLMKVCIILIIDIRSGCWSPVYFSKQKCNLLINYFQCIGDPRQGSLVIHIIAWHKPYCNVYQMIIDIS